MIRPMTLGVLVHFRLGQEPPPRPEADADYDGRSLYEVRIVTSLSLK